MKGTTIFTIQEVTSHFESWRTTRKGKTRIPAHLWQEALALYPMHPIAEISKALKLGYTDFKNKMRQLKKENNAADFIKIEPFPGNIDRPSYNQTDKNYQATTIELEKGDGSRIRIQRELNDQDLISIVKGYLGGASCCS